MYFTLPLFGMFEQCVLKQKMNETSHFQFNFLSFSGKRNVCTYIKLHPYAITVKGARGSRVLLQWALSRVLFPGTTYVKDILLQNTKTTVTELLINRRNSVERTLASNPLFIIPGFSLHFPLELSYGYLCLKGNGKIPLGRQGKRSLKGRAYREK